jgi:hexosaminidase
MMPIDILIPKPVKLTPMDGVFRLTADTIIAASGAASTIGHTLAQALTPATGYWLAVTSLHSGANAIEIELSPELARLGGEGYQLNVAQEKVALRAPQPAGLFYGVQSLLQLLPPEILRQAQVENVAWTIPCIQIEDTPAFGWRGAMLDVGRHFAPKAFVKKFIDLLALHKLNTFHWHLTEDQGWRIEIEQYPRLTEIGAWRKETLIGKPDRNNPANDKYDGKPHGGFYTQDDVREIVAYARARYVNVVPEIEMPGHAQAAIAAYPELGNTGQPIEVGATWGIYENVYNVEESTFQFLQNVLAEVLALFPSPFIHIGGDECPKAQWKASPQAQARMKELGLQDEEELQSYFVRRMDEFLTGHGRRLVGWDEILEGGLAPNATVMSWRGEKGGIAAARAGHDVVMAPNTSTYLDYYQSEDRSKEPLAIGGFVSLEKVYTYQPIPQELTPEEARHVLGAQAQLWAEYMPDTRHVEYMAFPRLCALAEATWTPGAAKDYADFTRRLGTHLKRLSILDVNYRPLDR